MTRGAAFDVRVHGRGRDARVYASDLRTGLAGGHVMRLLGGRGDGGGAWVHGVRDGVSLDVLWVPVSQLDVRTEPHAAAASEDVRPSNVYVFSARDRPPASMRVLLRDRLVERFSGLFARVPLAVDEWRLLEHLAVAAAGVDADLRAGVATALDTRLRHFGVADAAARGAADARAAAFAAADARSPAIPEALVRAVGKGLRFIL